MKCRITDKDGGSTALGAQVDIGVGNGGIVTTDHVAVGADTGGRPNVGCSPWAAHCGPVSSPTTRISPACGGGRY
ncbi:MAG: hypothetical protein ACJ8F7_10625 [Gemmataceae bacterium]